MSTIFTTVASGLTTGMQFDLARSDRAHVVHVPSLGAPSSVRLQFAPNSGGIFCDVFKDDGSGALAYVASGSGDFFGRVQRPASPWGRVVLGAAQADTTSLFLVPETG